MTILENRISQLTTILQTWNELKNDNGFIQKYMYIEYEQFKWLNSNDLFLQIRTILLNIKDIERYTRRLVIKTLHPSELFNLYSSIKNCKLLFKLLKI